MSEVSVWGFVYTSKGDIRLMAPINAINTSTGVYSLATTIQNTPAVTISDSVTIDTTSPLSITDYYFEAARGNISDVAVVVITAHNPDVDTAAEEDIWEGGGTLSYLTDAEQMDIASTSDEDSGAGGVNPAGTGVRLLKVDGLNSNYDEITENIIPDGTTAVTTTKTYLRVRSMTSLSGGSSPSNVGTITATSATSSTLQCQVGIDDGLSKNIHYTIPANKTAFILKVEMNATKVGGSSPIVEFRGLVRQLGGMWLNVFDRRLDTSVADQFDILQAIMPPLPQKSDIRIAATTTTNNTDIFCRFLILLADN